MAITALPTPPTRNDPSNFATRADAFLAALPTFTTEANALQVDVNSKQGQAATSATNAANSAVTAGNSQTAAAASAASAAASAGVTAWDAGTNYAVGVNVYDTTDLLTYRRKVAGTTATRPGLDTTNWQLIAGDATLGTAQTFTGVKTFSQTIVGTIQNANALTDGTVLCPPGMLMYYANSTPPAGWLKANGALLDTTTYAALFAAIGYMHGGSGSNFNVPDLRGEFIRGWDDARGVDTGRALATFQDSANLSHNHTASSDTHGGHVHAVSTNTGINGSSSASVSSSVNFNNTTTNYNTSSAGAHSHTITVNASGSAESRPRNRAMLACIKY